VFRIALLALALTIVVLVSLSLLPQPTRQVPGGTIALTGATVTLYPQADPEAIWHFAAENVDYEPELGETILHDIKDASRTVAHKTDFTLTSEQITIDAQENLRGDVIEVYLPDVAWTLDMRGSADSSVLIDQEQGRFNAPSYTMVDRTDEPISRGQNMSMNFDLTDMRTGGEGTKNSDSFRDSP
jgi:hypothetical protein